MTRCTQPAPMSWSNKMSEIGPMSVRRRAPRRMISWPAAYGTRASRPSPIATETPSETNLSIASDMDILLSVIAVRARAASCSFVRELGHLLADVGVEPFLRVLALEEQLLQLALDGERLRERHLRTGLHRAFDVPDRLGGLVRRRELLRVGHHVAHEPLAVAVVDLRDHAKLLRFLEREGPPGHHELERFR